jgi:serine protease Do
MSKNKILLIAIFFGVLLSGFIFGHYVFTAKSEIQTEQNSSAGREQTNRDITDSRRNAITETVGRVSSAVVGINVTEIREYRDPFFEQFKNDPFFRQFFGDQSYKQEVHGLGSGYIISDDGYIVTNEHVVGNATKVVITMTNGEHADADIVGKDPASDIALLKVNKENLPHVTFGNSDDVIIGEWVVALGNPFGLFEVNQKPTVTVGVVSSTGMKLQAAENRFYRDMIQTDAAINAGNSGGPLVNSTGEVIGMNTIIYTASQYYQGNIGLGFAIPINKVKKIIDELKGGGKIERNYWLGLKVQTVDNSIAQYYKLKNTEGVIIVAVERGSPSDDAGIKTEDIVLEVNGEKVNSDADFLGIISESKVGDKLKLKVLRNGSETEKQLELKTK